MEPNDNLNPNRVQARSYHLHKAAGRTEMAEVINKRMTEKLGAELWTLLLANTEKEAKTELLSEKIGEKMTNFLELLDGKELSVFELCAASGMSQPTVCRWLNTLKAHGMIQELPPVRLPARWKRA